MSSVSPVCCNYLHETLGGCFKHRSVFSLSLVAVCSWHKPPDQQIDKAIWIHFDWPRIIRCMKMFCERRNYQQICLCVYSNAAHKHTYEHELVRPRIYELHSKWEEKEANICINCVWGFGHRPAVSSQIVCENMFDESFTVSFSYKPNEKEEEKMDFCVVKGSQESRLCYYCRTICFVGAHGCAGKMRLSFVYFVFVFVFIRNEKSDGGNTPRNMVLINTHTHSHSYRYDV